MESLNLTFTSAHWKGYCISVQTSHDNDGINDVVTLTHTVSGGRVANSASESPVKVTVVDDEPGVRLSPNKLTVEEGKTGTYTVVLKTKPKGPVPVTVTPR